MHNFYVIKLISYANLMQGSDFVFLGIDNGCTYTKTSTRKTFPSLVLAPIAFKYFATLLQDFSCK